MHTYIHYCVVIIHRYDKWKSYVGAMEGRKTHNANFILLFYYDIVILL